jgi:hypothetical protein
MHLSQEKAGARGRAPFVAPLLGLVLLTPGFTGCNAPPKPSEVSISSHALTTPAWAPNKSYAVGTLVTYSGIIYQARQAHTSRVGWEPPNAPSLWMRPTPTGITAWAVQTNYVKTSSVTFSGKLYECISAHVSQSDWKPSTTPTLWRCASGCCTGSNCVSDPLAPPPPLAGDALMRGPFPEPPFPPPTPPPALPLTKEDLGLTGKLPKHGVVLDGTAALTLAGKRTDATPLDLGKSLSASDHEARRPAVRRRIVERRP